MDARETRYALEIPGGLSFKMVTRRQSSRSLGYSPSCGRPGGSPRLSGDGRYWGMALISRAVGGGAMVARAAVRVAPVSQRVVLLINARFHRRRGGMDGDGARAAALDRSRVMLTSDAVTPMPGLVVPFVVFTIIYLGLGAVVVALIRRTVLETAPGATAR